MASKIYSLDTNAILRVILNDIPEQRDIVTLLISRRQDYFRVHDLAISEAVYVMERQLGRKRQNFIADLVDFLKFPSILYNSDIIDPSLHLYLSHPKLSFNDCYLAVKSEQTDSTPLLTFDKKLSTQLTHTKYLGK